MIVKNHMAILRNLRNIYEANVDKRHLDKLLSSFSDDSWARSRILPFRFITAARYAPQWEAQIEQAMLRCLQDKDKLPGKTILLIDVSGSMDSKISDKSDLMRYDAANGLAILARELCENVDVYTFSTQLVYVPARHGFALRDAITNSQGHGGTYLGKAITAINGHEKYDRIIVLTDEQTHDAVPAPNGKGYVINVAAYQNGIGYGDWQHIDGFSEAVFDYIIEVEKTQKVQNTQNIDKEQQQYE